MTDDVPIDGSVFELKISDFVPYINPKDYGITDFDGIDPAEYFITSGDAVQKATFMEQEMWAAAGAARKLFGKSKDKRQQSFVKDVWSAAGKCRSLLNKLKSVRGQAVFLEVEWRDHGVWCIPKNPRKKEQNVL